jgi:hypothetical protein
MKYFDWYRCLSVFMLVNGGTETPVAPVGRPVLTRSSDSCPPKASLGAGDVMKSRPYLALMATRGDGLLFR